MAIYQRIGGKLVPIKATTFSDAGIKERSDLQQFLKQQVDIIAPDTLVISEEFGDWTESRRRIDLLAVDNQGSLVVIELKRTEDGGHMELQALRYAAMASLMTFDKAVETYERYLAKIGQDLDARDHLMNFLGWEDSDTDDFPANVRIVLAAADFSKEITTTAMWLNDQGLFIKCVRIRPHDDNGRLLLDVQQVIPLPEAEDYQIQLREKKVAERVARTQNRDFTRYEVKVDGKTLTNLPKRRAVYEVIRALCDAGVDPEAIRATVPWKSTILVPVDGLLDSDAFDKALAAQMIAQGRQPQTFRFFTDNSDLIHANGKTYAATKMWGRRTALAIEELLSAFPAHGISFKESA